MMTTVRLNQLLALATVLVFAVGVIFLAMFWWLPAASAVAGQHLVPTTDSAVALPPKLALTRNIFDPTGQTWQGAARRAAAGTNGDIKGLIDLPGLSGVLTADQFVPAGGVIGSQRIEAIAGGRVVINGSQGPQEIDINQERQQRLEVLPLRVE